MARSEQPLPSGRQADNGASEKGKAGPPGWGEPEDPAFVEALRRGDEDAYEALVRSYAGPLLAVSRRFLHNDDDARDAVQAAFISAFKALGGFQGQSRLSTWLHRIVVNAALMKLRSKRRKPEEAIEDLLPRFDSEGVLVDRVREWKESPERLLQRKEVREMVRASIDQLPDSYREVILLRDIEELDTEETARLLDVTANAVKIRLHRARLALRNLLDEAMADNGASS